MTCKGQNSPDLKLKENEKQLSAILDSLDNEYYWQRIREDMMSSMPPMSENFDKKYPFRKELVRLCGEVFLSLKNPMSGNYLLSLFNPKYTRIFSYDYMKVIDKIILLNDDSINLELWNIIMKKSTGLDYVDDQLRKYLVRTFIINAKLKNETRAYILEHNDFNVGYFGYFEKSIDFKIIDAQIDYLTKNQNSRLQSHLFIENGIRFPNCNLKLQEWYLEEHYYTKNDSKEKIAFKNFDWDSDKKNCELTIRFLRAIKDNYSMLRKTCEKK